jgi:hypothetical protein
MFSGNILWLRFPGIDPDSGARDRDLASFLVEPPCVMRKESNSVHHSNQINLDSSHIQLRGLVRIKGLVESVMVVDA